VCVCVCGVISFAKSCAFFFVFLFFVQTSFVTPGNGIDFLRVRIRVTSCTVLINNKWRTLGGGIERASAQRELVLFLLIKGPFILKHYLRCPWKVKMHCGQF
jgi:hypothetical protein